MRITTPAAAAVLATALLSACSGNNALQPAHAGAGATAGGLLVARPGTVLRHGAAGGRVARPNPSCCVQTLFVSDASANQVQLYDFATGTHVNTLAQPTTPAAPFNLPQGECTEPNNPQHVFITNTAASTIDEYTHAGAFVMQLNDSGEAPVSCDYRATSSTSGLLAVGNIETLPGSFGGNIAIYTNTNGVWAGPTIYNPPGTQDWRVYFVAYKGATLYFDATHYSGQFTFAKMSPIGNFTQIPLSGAPCVGINFPGGVAHIGNYLAIGDQAPNSACPNILHVQQNGTVVGSTTLSTSPSDLAQFVRKGPNLVGVDLNGPNADIYTYASGALNIPVTTFLTQPIGAAISHQ